MSKKTFVLSSQHIVDNACTCLLKHWAAYNAEGKTLVVEIRRENRRTRQNARYWSIISDFAQHVPNQAGKFYLAEQWHELFKAWFIGQIELPDGRYIPLSSKDLTIPEFAAFSEKVEAWLNEQGYQIKEAA